MLNSLDERLSPQDPAKDNSQLLTRYHAQAMHLCSQRFEGAVDISRMITQIVQSTPIQLPLRTKQPIAPIPEKMGAKAQSWKSSRNMVGYWDELFVTRHYMQLRLSLDYALITGRPPTLEDIPSHLLRDAGGKRFAMGPIHSLSSVTLHTPRKRRASESVAGLPRVIELDESPTNDVLDTGTSGSFDDSMVPDMQVVVRREELETLSRPFFEYDTIWAANLFEEITDGLWS
jgi:hypothetical protein